MTNQMVYILIASFLKPYICKVANYTLLNYAGLFICPQHDVKYAVIVSLELPVQNFKGIPIIKSRH